MRSFPDFPVVRRCPRVVSRRYRHYDDKKIKNLNYAATSLKKRSRMQVCRYLINFPLFKAEIWSGRTRNVIRPPRAFPGALSMILSHRTPEVFNINKSLNQESSVFDFLQSSCMAHPSKLCNTVRSTHEFIQLYSYFKVDMGSLQFN